MASDAPIQQPIVDKNGAMTPAWVSWFTQSAKEIKFDSYTADPPTAKLPVPYVFWNSTDLKLKIWNGVEITLLG